MRECQVCKQCYPDAVTNCPQDSQPTFQSIDGNPILEGKYKLEKRLGQGGMGVVYQARHNYLKTSHAIKVILPDLVGNDPQLVTRFRQEALAAAAIRHHNVVQVTDYGVANETMPFLVMEYVQGESLHDLLAREKRLSPEKAIDLMAAICAGVGAAHKQGIVHRDLKPLNVMILKDSHTPAEGIKILDFGLAKIKSGELLGSFIQAQTTGLMGSPYYMAPEQWADEDLEPQADIYSLGVMLYQMIAGDVPFKGSSIPAIMQKHLNNPPPTFKEMGVDVPIAVEAAVRHSLEKDRTKRTQTVQEFVEELRHSVGQGTQPLSMPGMTGALPVSAIHVLTQPPQSTVFVDNVQIGESQNDGYLLIEGIQSGNHRVRVSKAGFHDWENQIFCDGKPQQVVAQLQHASGGINPAQTVISEPIPSNQNFGQTQGQQGGFQQTGSQSQYQQSGQGSQIGMQGSQLGMQQGSQQNWQASGQQSYIAPPPKPFFTPLVLAVIGIFALLLLTVIGIGGGYMAGLFGGTKPTPTSTPIGTTPTKSPTPSPTGDTKNEMVAIPGGKFKMGNNEGLDREQPEHEVEVKDFQMSKLEISNAEYAEFVTAANYKAPEHWINAKPVAGEENLPVNRVTLEDAKAYAAWLSKKENAKYRLPTEQEWEYVARNGSANNLYPWGDKWEENRAILDQTSPKPVGSATNGANKWGVQDLIGNISEWTETEFQKYDNSKFAIPNDAKGTFATRGGSYVISSANSKITSATRYFAPSTAKDARLGFRLVRSN